MRKKVTVLFSGGIDSTSCIRFFTDRDYEVHAVFVDFGQASVDAETRAVESLKNELDVTVTSVKAASDFSYGTATSDP